MAVRRVVSLGLAKYDLKRILQPYSPFVSSLLHQSTTPKPLNKDIKKPSEEQNQSIPSNVRFVYPEFLPDPKIEWRNPIRELLERQDMLNRRKQIDIPEFYVGSIMAVTSYEPHSQGKISRFVGICIHRSLTGLRAKFVLRNVVDGQGIEIMYQIYHPTIQKIEVLKLEKRLDNELYYLRDALPEYSTFPFEMEPEFLAEGAPVPVNPIKVKMKPRPWVARWERKELKGIEDLGLPERFYKRAAEVATPWEEYDIVKHYRKTIPAEEQEEIYSQVYSTLSQMEQERKKTKRKKVFVRPKKTA